MSGFDANAIRALFPAATERVYLDVSVQGLMPTPVRDAIDAYLGDRMGRTRTKDQLHSTVEETRAAFAGLIGAEPDEVAQVKNVSEGLNLFAGSLPWQAGDNIVLCPELEHPNNVYLWYAIRDRHGVEVRAIEPTADDRIKSVDAWAQKHFSDEEYGAISQIATTASGVKTLEKMMKMTGSSSMENLGNGDGSGAQGDTEAEIMALMDTPAYYDPARKDPKVIQRVEAFFARKK